MYETAKITRAERDGFGATCLHAKRDQVDLGGARKPPDEDKNDDDSPNNGIRINHRMLTPDGVSASLARA